jgi:hypothetical protein
MASGGTGGGRHATIEIICGGITLRVRERLDVEHVARLVEALASRARGC